MTAAGQLLKREAITTTIGTCSIPTSTICLNPYVVSTYCQSNTEIEIGTIIISILNAPTLIDITTYLTETLTTITTATTESTTESTSGISVSSTSSAPSITPTIPSRVGNYVYDGSYEASPAGSRRSLGKRAGDPPPFTSASMTVEKCYSYCNGYTYFALTGKKL